jgi:hypothetical protein
MKFEISQIQEKISANGGLTLIGKLFNRSQIKNVFKCICTGKRKPVFSTADIFLSYLGILAMGKSSYKAIGAFRKNKLFRKALGIKQIASPETIRQRFGEVATSNSIRNLISKANIAMLKHEEFGKVKTQYKDYIPLDVDVSPLDNSGTKKERCSYTYKGYDGFAPIFAYIGSEGHMLNSELRPGSQHCQLGTPEFLQECIEMTDSLGISDQILLRLDSGNDAADNFYVIHEKYKYIIKRNLRNESPEQWLALAKRLGTAKKIREGKIRYTGTTSHKVPGNKGDLPAVEVVFEVTERSIDSNGNFLLIPEIDVNTYWTNLPDDADSIINLYHNHGKSEQFHSELKTDMDLERLPANSLATNELVLRLAMLSFNALKTIGIDTAKLKELAPIKINVKRRRIKSILQDIIYSACKYVESGGYHKVKFGYDCAWYPIISKLYQKYT